MKLLLTSVDAVIDFSTGKPFEGILEVFDLFEKLEEGNMVVVISSHKEKLALLPEDFPAVQFSAENRGSDSPIKEFLLANSDYNDRSKIIVLAANDADFFTAVNTKIFFLGAAYARDNNPSSKAYDYGLQIYNVEELSLFFERFFTVKNPWYYRLNIGGNFSIYSLTNSNTLGGRSQDIIDLNNKFKQCLKEGNEETRYAFAAYFMMGVYDIVNEVEDIGIWSVYPSSKIEQESDLDYFKELARTTFKGRSKEPLFVRHRQAVKRSDIGDGNRRVSNGCEDQFATMYINPKYKKKLLGATVGVIDDFTSYGTSAETVRALLEKAGVTKIIFLTLGKFGKPYYQYSYRIDGDVFSPNYTATRLAIPVLLSGTPNSEADNAFVTSLKGLV
ncbi:MAG: phosphoribosyltransferase [Sphingobacteriaceae bacterium]|nr:MAG: phosphoribosyltransferase [Sphingobacteriaceae bacterium]